MRKQKRRERKEPLDIEITSLLDILVILLVFLLGVYNTTDLDNVNLIENLTLPISKSPESGNKAIILQVNRKKEVWLEGEKIGQIELRKEGRGKVIEFLLESLSKKREEAGLKAKASLGREIAEEKGKGEKDKDPKRINILLDEELPYQVLQKIMHTSATAGYTEFKFLVQGIN